MAAQTIHGMLKPEECALALIDFQPAMFAGVHSHDRTLIVQNVQIVGKRARLFKVPTILSTVAARSSSVLAGVRAMTEVFPLERAAEAYEHMMSGKARFRVVLTTGR